jgi:hypothetical protein
MKNNDISFDFPQDILPNFFVCQKSTTILSNIIEGKLKTYFGVLMHIRKARKYAILYKIHPCHMKIYQMYGNNDNVLL